MKAKRPTNGIEVEEAESGAKWPLVSLGQFAKAKGGFGFPLERQGKKVGRYPFFKVSDMNLAANRKYMVEANNWVDDADLVALKAKTFPAGSVIFPKIGATIMTNKKRLLTRESVIDNNLVGIVISDKAQCEFGYLYQWFQTVDLGKLANPGPVPSIASSRLHATPVPLPPIKEQARIAGALGLVQRAVEQEEQLLRLTAVLKKSLMQKLFAEGLRGEPQRETEIGFLPASSRVVRLEECCDVLSGSLSYTDFLASKPYEGGGAVPCMGVKVSDMNLPGNEEEFRQSNLEKPLAGEFAKRKLVPAGCIVFPKRGAAIATNKKRMTTQWTVLDPNLIALRAGNRLDERFLFHWMQTFDLRTITAPGPTPQLNKKDLLPVLMPVPDDKNEQREVALAIDTVSKKCELHRKKRDSLSALFRTVLHQLMTGQIRVNELDLSEVEKLAA